MLSNENRNKPCRDDDDTMANGYNKKLPVKLNRRCDTGDGVPYHGEVSYLVCFYRRKELRSNEN